MNHRRAQRLLPALLDHGIPARREALVREHIERCARCANALAELEACEQLLRALPAALLPLKASEDDDRRLAALARWANVPPLAWPTRLGLQAVGAFAAAFLLLMVISIGQWTPLVEARNESGVVSIAGVPAASVTPYTWR